MNLNLLAALAIVVALAVSAIIAYPPSISFSGGIAVDIPTATEAAPVPTSQPSFTEPLSPPNEPGPAATAVAGTLPAGLQGQVTLRRQRELITLQLPERGEIRRMRDPGSQSGATSADGNWTARLSCEEARCDVVIAGPEGYTRTLQTGGQAGGLEWSPAGPVLAYRVGFYEGDDYVGGEINLFDIVSAEPRSVVELGPSFMRPSTWLATGDLLVAMNGELPVIDSDDRGPATLLRIAPDGSRAELGSTVAPVSYFYPSPDRSRVAFTQDAPEGWRLWTIEAQSGALEDVGNMGSDPAGVQPPAVSSPKLKGPMSVSWSPDSSKLAFSGGTEPPYLMTVVDVTTGAVARTEFVEGYAGEMAWSPDGATLGVSTYDADRTRHEVYVVDPATGAARYLVAGCLIVWSPDGRFLALHAERQPGIAVVDVDTGQYGMLTDDASDVPLTWE